MNKLYLISLGICLVIGGFIGYSIHGDKDCPEATTNTLIEYRYIDRVDTLRVPKFTTKRDTTYIPQIDTFFVETKYIAEIDTTYEDSSLSAKVSFVSDIPLSEKSYFDLRFKIREKIVTNTVYVEKETSFFDNRFIPYLGIGIGYNGKTIEPNLQLGFGIRIN